MRKIFIDAGANVGNSIQLFLDKYPSAEEFTIHSFEANPKLHTPLDKYRDRATIHHEAVYRKDTTLKFYLGGSLNSSIRKDKTSGHLNKSVPIEVKAINLAQFIKENFDKEDYIILKLDVEGAEYDILPHLLEEGIFDGWVSELFGEWHQRKLSKVTLEQHTNLVSNLSDKGFYMKDWCAERNIIEL